MASIKGEPPTAIVFIGPPGSGKTACAQAVAQRLAWAVMDTDRFIEADTGMTVAQIFEELGEPRFRELESALLDRLAADRSNQGSAQVQPLVIATGGGMPVAPGNFERLAALGEVIALGADLDVLAARLLADGGRPLLAGKNHGESRPACDILKEKLSGLLTQRAPIYAQARYKLDTEGLTPEDIAEEVLKLLRLTA